MSRSVPAEAASNHERLITLVCLLCGLMAPLVFIPFAILAGRETPGYSHIRSTFSDSGAQGQPHPEIIGAGLLLLAFMLAVYAHGLKLALPRGQLPASVAVLAVAISIGATGIFQDHNRSPYVQRNLEGYTHNFFAMTAIFSVIAATIFINRGIAGQPGWTILRIPGLVIIVLISLSGSAFYLVGDSYDGLAERAFAGIALSWLVLVATNGIRLTVNAPEPTPMFNPEAASLSMFPVAESSTEQ